MPQRVALYGNCQIVPVANSLRMLSSDLIITSMTWAQAKNNSSSLGNMIASCDLVIVQSDYIQSINFLTEQMTSAPKILEVPTIFFDGYHPDAVNISISGRSVGNIGDFTSGIALAAYAAGLDRESTLSLYNTETFEKIGYCNRWAKSKKLLIESANSTALPVTELFPNWLTRGPFMHVSNHPKLFVSTDMARNIVEIIGSKIRSVDVSSYLNDRLMDSLVWPIYPGLIKLSEAFDGYIFRQRIDGHHDVFELKEMIDRCFFHYTNLGDKISLLECPSLKDPDFVAGFQIAVDSLRFRRRRPKPDSSPYRDLHSYQYWQSAMAKLNRKNVDPVVRSELSIGVNTRVATAGSCFSQYIARELRNNGFCHLVTEHAPAKMSKIEAEAKQYGVFSARFGNIYTAGQLNQLIRRAYGDFNPEDDVWRVGNKFLDPFRPSIEPLLFDKPNQVRRDREIHLKAVRSMFESCDVFIFTLGLTESWIRKSDGAVFPTAPAAVSERVKGLLYDFKNFSAEEVADDLLGFCQYFSKVNKTADILFTVSPIPLIATFEDQHVLVATTYSKSVLRVAVEMVVKKVSNAIYFPAYEIVTGPHAGGVYYEEDLRSVSAEGIDHVMSVFFAHYGIDSQRQDNHHVELNSADRERFRQGLKLICDEEWLIQ